MAKHRRPGVVLKRNRNGDVHLRHARMAAAIVSGLIWFLIIAMLRPRVAGGYERVRAEYPVELGLVSCLAAMVCIGILSARWWLRKRALPSEAEGSTKSRAKRNLMLATVALLVCGAWGLWVAYSAGTLDTGDWVRVLFALVGWAPAGWVFGFEVALLPSVQTRKGAEAAIDGGSEAPESVQRRTPTSEEGNEDEE